MFAIIRFPLVLSFYILAAITPAALLLRYIYRCDTIEKEPAGLLASLLLLGTAAAVISSFLESVGEKLLTILVEPGSPVYIIILSFLVVALVEEGTKFILLKWRTWYCPDFNYRFDGIVYAVFLSLGFAAYENIQYVLHFGLSVALPRAFLSVPGHLVFAVMMGFFYSRAKRAESRKTDMGTILNLWLAYFTAVLVHGFYDACAMIGSSAAVFLFVVFVLSMYLLVYRLIKRESSSDAPI